MTALEYPKTSLTKSLSDNRGRYSWIITGLSLWLIGGIHLDAWAHHQFELETFFTPWHGVLYSGFLALAIVLSATFIRNLKQGHVWQEAMPAGYEFALLGVLIFLAGGLGDMLWHITFGIEVNIEALLSPTHLLLAVGGGLMITGPLRAAWWQTSPRVSWAALTSLALLLALLTFFTAYASPLSEGQFARGLAPTGAPASQYLSEAVGVAGILIQTVLMVGVLLLAIRRWTLPFGSLTLLLTLSTLLTVSVHADWSLLPLATLTGLAGDALIHQWKPSAARRAAFRRLAFVLPVIFFSLYFATLALSGGLWWKIHVWAGAIVLSGIVGWLLSYAFVPPDQPADLNLNR